MPAFLIFFFLVGIPALEIALFIQIGGEIGVWGTLGAIVLTALIGTALVRAQGLRVVSELQEETQAGRTPVAALAKGACLLVAGLLLVTPGFFTDAIGFALLLPPVQELLFKSLIAKILNGSAQRGFGRGFTHRNPRPGAGSGHHAGPHNSPHNRPGAGPIVDGDYEVVSPDGGKNRGDTDNPQQQIEEIPEERSRKEGT